MNAVDITARGLAQQALQSGTSLASPEGATRVGAAHGGTVQDAIDARTVNVADRAALTSNAAVAGQGFYLAEHEREGSAIAIATADMTARETAAMALDTEGDVFVPSSTPNLTIMRRLERDRPEQFASYGDVNDRTQAALAIQKAMNVAAALGRPLQFRADLYEIDRGLNVPSCLIMEGDAPGWGLINTLTPAEAAVYADEPPAGTSANYWSNPNYPFCCLFIGAMHPVYMPLATGTGSGLGGSSSVRYFDWKPAASVALNDRQVALAVSADAAAFTRGALVWVRSAEYFSTLGGRNEFPDFACLRRVKIAGDGATGIIVLDRPIPAEIASPYVALANFTSSTIDLANVNPYTCDRPRIDGMTLIADTDRGMPYFRTSAYDGQLHFEHIEGFETHSINAMWNTEISALSNHSRNKVIEFAQNSGQVTVRDSTATYSYNPGLSTANVAKAMEQAFDCRYEWDVLRMVGPSSAAVGSCFAFLQASNVRFKSGRTIVTGKWDQIVSLSTADPNADGHDAGQTAYLTESCHLTGSIDASGATFNNLTRMTNGGMRDGIQTLRRPRIDLDEFSGTPDIRLADVCGHYPTLRGFYTSGGPSSSAGVRQINIGTSTTTGAEVVISGPVPIETFNQGLSRRVNVNGIEYRTRATQISTGATTYSPDFRIPDVAITFTGASFQLTAPAASSEGMRQRVTLINGSGATITPTAAAVFLGVAFPVLVAGGRCSFMVERIDTSGGFARYRIVEPVSGPVA